MSATLFAGLLLAQSAYFVAPTTIEKVDVAYEAMAQGRTDAAISQLQAQEHADAATLINLGSAYARKGMRAEALECFNAAMAADRYELQLADGSWMDSRRAARVAAARLERAGTLAAR